MSFREKSAWITLVSVLLCTLALVVGWVGRSDMPTLHYSLLSVVGLVLIQAVLHVVAIFSNLREARAPRDERELMIANRARSLGYYVLLVWMVGIVIAAHIPNFRHYEVLLMSLLGIVVSSAIVAFMQIIQFRRGA